MEQLVFDSGIKEYQINDRGILRFNPSDPNVYARFMDAMEKIREVESSLTDRAKEIEQMEDRQASGAAVLQLMTEADRKTKAVLSEVFGQDNDFDEILGGVNLLAVAGNGERVITNLLTALQPIMASGVEHYTQQQVDAAVGLAKQNRAQRREVK